MKQPVRTPYNVKQWSLDSMLISILLVITGVLGIIAIQGHTLTANKNVEQRIMALLALDSVEETMLAVDDSIAYVCKKEMLTPFNRLITTAGSFAQLSLWSGCPIIPDKNVNIFVFRIDWQELSSFAETYNLTPDRMTMVREVPL